MGTGLMLLEYEQRKRKFGEGEGRGLKPLQGSTKGNYFSVMGPVKGIVAGWVGVLELLVTRVVGYVDITADGNPSVIQSGNLRMQDACAPVGQMPALADLRDGPTANDGQIDLECKAPEGTATLAWPYRLHSDRRNFVTLKKHHRLPHQPHGPNPRHRGRTPRLRAVGAAGAGTWSDEAAERTP